MLSVGIQTIILTIKINQTLRDLIELLEVKALGDLVTENLPGFVVCSVSGSDIFCSVRTSLPLAMASSNFKNLLTN